MVRARATTINVTCTTSVSRSFAIGKRVLVQVAGVVSVRKAITKTLVVQCASTVSIATNFILRLIRTKVFGRGAARARVSGQADPTSVAGKASGRPVKGYPEPFDPEAF
jgi:hypothetical protein